MFLFLDLNTKHLTTFSMGEKRIVVCDICRSQSKKEDRSGLYHMVVGFTTTCATVYHIAEILLKVALNTLTLTHPCTTFIKLW